MKTTTILSVLALFIGLSLSACGGGHSHGKAEGNTQGSENTNTLDKSGPEYTSAYICPMHCPGSGSEQPGTCPVCGMDYVAKADEDHDHSHGPGDHDHSH
jgi:hypothetical protein